MIVGPLRISLGLLSIRVYRFLNDMKKDGVIGLLKKSHAGINVGFILSKTWKNLSIFQ